MKMIDEDINPRTGLIDQKLAKMLEEQLEKAGHNTKISSFDNCKFFCEQFICLLIVFRAIFVQKMQLDGKRHRCRWNRDDGSE